MAKKPTPKPTPAAAAPDPDRPILRSVSGEPDADNKPTERISITLTPDGNAIDWERMRPGTRDKLRALTGQAPADAAAAPVDPAIVGMLYGSLGSLMVSIARAKGFTAEQANVLIFTAEEKQALQEPTAKVLTKYAGAMGKYQDEIMLTVTLGMVLTGKISALRKTAPVIEMVRDKDADTEASPAS